MKEIPSRDREIPCFLLVGLVLLCGGHVTAYGGGCPGGEEGVLDRGMLEVVMSWMPRQLRNPGDICQSRVGADSTLCREAYASNYSGICSAVWCSVPPLGLCTVVSPYDGIQCGEQQWCYDGICQYSEHAVSVEDSCPFGDDKEFTRDGLSCDELVSRDRKQCYDDVTQQMCCGSCTVAKLNQAGCEYGDSMTGCRGDACASMTQEERKMCCQTCDYYTMVVPTRGPDKTHPSPVTPIIQTRTPERKTTRAETAQMTSSVTSSQPSSQIHSKPTSSFETTDSETGLKQTTTIKTTSRPGTSTDMRRSVTSSSTLTTGVKAETEAGLTTTRLQPASTPGVGTTPSPTVKADGTTSNVLGQVDAQQDTPNVVAIGTGVGIGSLVAVVVVVIVVYITKKRLSSAGVSTPLEESMSDDQSIGGDSTASLSTGMVGSSSRWYPSYRANHAFE